MQYTVLSSLSRKPVMGIHPVKTHTPYTPQPALLNMVREATGRNMLTG